MKLGEAITIDVRVGDTILMGKYKNKRVVVKDIGTDEHGMPTINGKKAATFRTTQRPAPDAPTIKGEGKMKRSELREMIREEIKAAREAWDKDVDVKPTGEYANKTVADIKSQMANLKGKKPFDRKKYSELMFALRAKQGWKKGEGATK